MGQEQPGAVRTERPVGTIVVVAVQAGVLGLLTAGSAVRGLRELAGGGPAQTGHRLLVGGLVLGTLAVLGAVAGGTLAAGRSWGRGLALASETALGLVGLSLVARQPAFGVALVGGAGVALLLLGRRGSVWDRPPPPPFPGSPPTTGTPDRVAAPSGSEPGRSTSIAIVLAVATTLILLAALVIRSRVVFAVVLLAVVFVPAERLLQLHPQRVLRRGWATDIVHFLVNNLITTAGVVLVLVSFIGALEGAVPASFQTAVHGQPFWLQFVEAVLLADVAAYLSHRASHQIPFLWRFHAVHHSIAEMDWLAAGRLHPVDATFRQVCVIVPLALMGFSKATFGGYLVFGTFLAIFQHSNIRVRYGPLRWVVVNPQAHHWHHANEPGHYNRNFAAALPLVDVVFGTAYIPARQWPARYGIDEPTPPGYLRQMAWPFRSGAGDEAPADRRCPRRGPPPTRAGHLGHPVDEGPEAGAGVTRGEGRAAGPETRLGM